MSEKPAVKVIHEAEDASWHPQGHAVFSLLLSDSMAAGSLFDKANQRFVALKAVEAEDAMSVLASKESLYGIFPMAQHRKMNFFLPGEKATLVPDALYSVEDRDAYFRLNYPLSEEKEEIEANPLRQLKANLIYSQPYGRKREIIYRFPGVNLFHQAVPWLDALVLMNKNSAGQQMHVDFMEKAVQMAVFKDAELQLFNIYPTETDEDKLYYVMYVSEQLKLNPQRDTYYLSGKLKKADKLHRLFSKYIKELLLQQRPAMFEYALPLKELPEHFLFKAYCTAVCAL